MITGEYIIDFIGSDKNGFEIAKGNSVIDNVEFDNAVDFYNTVVGDIKEEFPDISHVRIVGVFKL